jgi:hypothetical protein
MLKLTSGPSSDNIEDEVYCYTARVNTKRDWLICGHVTSDKCNVSRPSNKWKIVARPPTSYVHK